MRIYFHAAGHDSKGALHASRSSLAVIPPVGSHELLAADPSAVSTKQPAQQSELVFRGPHARKHVAFRCSTAPRKASEWQSRRIRLTTAFSRQWQPAVGAEPLHSPLAGIENHMPWSLSAAAAVAHAPIFDGPDPKPQNRPMPPEPRKSETFSRPTRAVHGLQLGGKCPSSQSHTYSPAVQA